MTIKLRGSKRVIIQCCECERTSEPFHVTLAEDDEGNIWLPGRDYPKGWSEGDEGELYDDVIYGFCPEHNSEYLVGQI